jgi:oligopeptide/dipeptide ABC transporter ATP-binding protein
MPSHEALLDVRGLTVSFPQGRGQQPLRAVDDVSFDVGVSETVALVGESGSGKTTIARAILGLATASRGEIRLGGEEITFASYRRRRELSRDLQVVFQDPYSSLNPTRTIGQTLAETYRVHHRDARREAVQARVGEMLSSVGLSAEAAARYPSHFSGGQRQRIAIARALMVEPQLVICDEPTSALDLSVQAQILNLLRELQDALNVSYLFISHDLAVVRHLSHRIVVLFRGQIVEHGNTKTVCDQPLHPYTQALLAAAPVPDPVEQRRRRTLNRGLSTLTASDGRGDSCPFVARCPHAVGVCHDRRPLLQAGTDGTVVACHRWDELRRPAAAARIAGLS